VDGFLRGQMVILPDNHIGVDAQQLERFPQRDAVRLFVSIVNHSPGAVTVARDRIYFVPATLKVVKPLWSMEHILWARGVADRLIGMKVTQVFSGIVGVRTLGWWYEHTDIWTNTWQTDDMDEDTSNTCDNYGSTALECSFTQGYTLSASFSGGAGLSVSHLSATFGWDVSYSTNKSKTVTRDIQPGYYGWLRWYDYYNHGYHEYDLYRCTDEEIPGETVCYYQGMYTASSTEHYRRGHDIATAPLD